MLPLIDRPLKRHDPRLLLNPQLQVTLAALPVRHEPQRLTARPREGGEPVMGEFVFAAHPRRVAAVAEGAGGVAVGGRGLGGGGEGGAVGVEGQAGVGVGIPAEDDAGRELPFEEAEEGRHGGDAGRHRVLEGPRAAG
jgi:hypothetical protein